MLQVTILHCSSVSLNVVFFVCHHFATIYVIINTSEKQSSHAKSELSQLNYLLDRGSLNRAARSGNLLRGEIAMKTYVTDKLPVILQNFISDYSKIYRSALVFTVNTRLTSDTSKSDLNTVLQKQFGLMKRHANAVITDADGMIGSAKNVELIILPSLKAS